MIHWHYLAWLAAAACFGLALLGWFGNGMLSRELTAADWAFSRNWAIAGVLLVLLTLAACTHPTVYRDRPVQVSVPVAQPCAGERPLPVKPLKEQVPPDEWARRDVRQKAALVGKQGLDRQTYGEQLAAATAACPPAVGAR